MSQSIRGLLPAPTDHSAETQKRWWLEAANDGNARAAKGASQSARFSLEIDSGLGNQDQAKPRSFRYRIDPEVANRNDGPLRPIEVPAKGWETDSHEGVRSGKESDPFEAFGIGDPSRNAPPFLASLIAQSRLGQGLAYSAHGAASEAYRVAGARPPLPDGQPRFLSIVI